MLGLGFGGVVAVVPVGKLLDCGALLFAQGGVDEAAQFAPRLFLAGNRLQYKHAGASKRKGCTANILKRIVGIASGPQRPSDTWFTTVVAGLAELWTKYEAFASA